MDSGTRFIYVDGEDEPGSGYGAILEQAGLKKRGA